MAESLKSDDWRLAKSWIPKWTPKAKSAESPKSDDWRLAKSWIPKWTPKAKSAERAMKGKIVDLSSDWLALSSDTLALSWL
jgi:hypothetical protein